MRLALLLLLAACAPSRAITSAGTNVSIAAQHVTGIVDSVKTIADRIERDVVQAPEYYPEGQAVPRSPLDAILQAAVTTTPDLIAIVRAGVNLVKQLHEMKTKAEHAP